MRRNTRRSLITWGLIALGSFGTIQAQKIQVKGYGQVYHSTTITPGSDSRDTQVSNGFTINKLEVLALGKLTNKLSMGIVMQLNSPTKLKEYYVQYAFIPELQVRIGQFKTPFAYENQVAPFDNNLILGGSMPTVFFAGVGIDPLYTGTTGRDMGIEIAGNLFDNHLSYRLMAMNGMGMNHADVDNYKTISGSLLYRPLDYMSLHTSYMGGKQTAMGSAYDINAGNLYTRHRFSFAIISDNSYTNTIAEYMHGIDNDRHSQGAYLTTAVHLPKCWDIVIGGDYLDDDLKSEGALVTSTIGLQHWIWRKCRWQLQYRYTSPLQRSHLLGGIAQHNLLAQVQIVF